MKQKILFLIFIAIFGIAAKAQTIVDSGDGWSLNSEGVLTVTKDISTSFSSAPWRSLVTSVKCVKIEEGVTNIGEYAFRFCSNLTSVTISSSVKSIGISAFSDCKNIDELHIGSVESWCNISFGNNSSNPLCVDLYSDKKIYLGNEVVKDIVIPTGVETIPNYAFYGCSDITSVTIPSTIKTIGNDAFRGCSKIVELHIGSVESWCNISFENNSSNPLRMNFSNKKLYLGNEEMTELIIPTGVKTIPDYAFYQCSGITSVTIAEGVENICEMAFNGCSSLTNIVIPEGVTMIGRAAFAFCSALTSVSIPTSVKEIENDAFQYCSKIDELHIGSVESWLNISWTGGVTFIYGTSPLCSSTNKKLFVGDKEVTELIIPDGVTEIPYYAFYKCSGIKSVTIPETVEKIGDYAFAYSGLTSVTIPENVNTIERGAFDNCSSLKSVMILPTQTVEYYNIGYKQFSSCTNLKYVFLHQTDQLVEIVSVFSEDVCKTVEKFFVPDEILTEYRSQYASNNDLKDKFTGFSLIEKRGANDTEEEIVALSLEKDSYDFITWAVNSGEQVRKGEEISIALTEDFDLDADNVAWQPLGTAEHPFKGIFEGNKHSVIGNHRANAVQPNSIFGYIGEGAEIRNVVFSGFIIDATSGGVTDGGTTYHGLVARENKGIIKNCIFEGRMEIDADAENADEAQACLVIDNEEGELDHVVGYFEGLDGEVTGNKTSIIVIQNIGHGRTRGSSKKTASNGKKKSKGNSTVSAEEPDDINLNYRLFTDEEFAGAEPAYWLNFDGEGYTGTFNGGWTQGTKHPVLAKGEHGATVGIKYNVVNRDESVIGPSPVFFATSKSSLEVEYSEKPLSIEVNGMEINASQIGDMKAKFSLASVNTDKGNVNVVLKYEKLSTPTSVDDIDAAGSKKTIKTVENGRIVIIRDGKKYDLAGRVVM